MLLYTSDVLAGIEWAIANRARYGIRIINLSLGHPVAEPAATDPSGQYLVWGTMADEDYLVWGTAVGDNGNR